MKKLIIEINSFCKGIILLIRPSLFLGFLSGGFLFLSNLLKLSKWVTRQNKSGIINDFYRPYRKYDDRIKLYSAVSKLRNLEKEQISYLEFGVYMGNSLKWWIFNNSNPMSRFYGFDTFKGLPEGWGTFKAGDMVAAIPEITDSRVKFIKGLFQNTLFTFLQNNNISAGIRVIHLDADLFSSTLFSLTSLAPYLKKGDILFFDEFNVPNHEFFAFNIFTESFYIKYKLLGAVNNYYQVAFEIC